MWQVRRKDRKAPSLTLENTTLIATFDSKAEAFALCKRDQHEWVYCETTGEWCPYLITKDLEFSWHDRDKVVAQEDALLILAERLSIMMNRRIDTGALKDIQEFAQKFHLPFSIELFNLQRALLRERYPKWDSSTRC